MIAPPLAQQAWKACAYVVLLTVALFAGVRVRDVTAARAWYGRLLGEPSFFRLVKRFCCCSPPDLPTRRDGSPRS